MSNISNMNISKNKQLRSPLFEKEKTVLSSTSPPMSDNVLVDNNDRDEKESVGSKLQEVVGKASEKMHAKLRETKEKVVDILSSKSNDDYKEVVRSREADTFNNISPAKQQENEEVIQVTDSLPPPPPPPNSAASTVDNDDVPIQKPDSLSILSGNVAQTLVDTKTDIDLTIALDATDEELQQGFVEIFPETIDVVLALALAGKAADVDASTTLLAFPLEPADLAALSDELIADESQRSADEEQDAIIIGMRPPNVQTQDTPSGYVQFSLDGEVQMLCNRLAATDDQVVVDSLDSLENIFQRASARGELESFQDFIAKCGGQERIERLMNHANSRIASRVESFRQSYLMHVEKPTDWTENDIITGLCSDLKGDDQTSLNALERLSDYLQAVPVERLSDVRGMIEGLGGLGHLIQLSNHAEEEYRQPAISLLRTYFPDLLILEWSTGEEEWENEVEEEEVEEGDFDEMFTNVQQLCEMLASDDEQTVLSALDTLAEMLSDLNDEATGLLLVRVLELVAICGGEEVFRALVDHENVQIQERAVSLVNTFFQPQYAYQLEDESHSSEVPCVDYATSGSALDQIAHKVQQGHVEELCEQLRSGEEQGEGEGGRQVVAEALQKLRDIMDTLGCNPLLLHVLRIVNECGGEKTLETLCLHEDPHIRERAKELLDVYFGEVEEQQDEVSDDGGEGDDEAEEEIEDENSLGDDPLKEEEQQKEEDEDEDEDEDVEEINYGLI